MASRYIANTPAEQREMLKTIGAASIGSTRTRRLRSSMRWPDATLS